MRFYEILNFCLWNWQGKYIFINAMIKKLEWLSLQWSFTLDSEPNSLLFINFFKITDDVMIKYRGGKYMIWNNSPQNIKSKS